MLKSRKYLNGEDQLKNVYIAGLPKTECAYLMENTKQECENGLSVYFQSKNEAEDFLAKEWKSIKEQDICVADINAMQTLVISESQSLLTLAAQCDFATIAWQKADAFEYLHADMIVEGFEEVDVPFLQRVYERHAKIPWTILETKRCMVQELELDDLPELFAMYAEPGMADYMEGLSEYRDEREKQQAYITNQYGFYGYGLWLIFEKETGRLIGRAGIEHREALDDLPELAYAIRTSEQGKGFAEEVCRAILDYAKQELEMTEIYCCIHEENCPSHKLAGKLGFVQKKKELWDGHNICIYWKKLE